MPAQLTSPEPITKSKRQAPRWAKICLCIGLVVVIIAGAIVAAMFTLSNRYEANIHRADLLGDNKNDGRTLGKVKGPLNILIIGSDTRADSEYNPLDPSSTQASVPGERSDTLMIAHIPKDMSRAYIVSIPRDTYTYVPATDDGLNGGYETKINAAYAWGGAPLAVKTVENFTHLVMDHVLVVNFGAIRTITDAVEGVEVNIDQAVEDPRSQRRFEAGPNHLDGRAAEDYVRQRYGLEAGDFDRMKRQQQYLRALITKVHQTNWLTSPKKFDDLMMAITSSLTVDNTMPVQKLAFTLREVRENSVSFLTMPIGYDGPMGDVGYVVQPDEAGAKELFQAIDKDTMHLYVAAHPPNDVTHGA